MKGEWQQSSVPGSSAYESTELETCCTAAGRSLTAPSSASTRSWCSRVRTLSMAFPSSHQHLRGEGQESASRGRSRTTRPVAEGPDELVAGAHVGSVIACSLLCGPSWPWTCRCPVECILTCANRLWTFDRSSRAHSTMRMAYQPSTSLPKACAPCCPSSATLTGRGSPSPRTHHSSSCTLASRGVLRGTQRGRRHLGRGAALIDGALVVSASSNDG